MDTIRIIAEHHYQLRRLRRASEMFALAAGIESTQYLALLQIAGLPEHIEPTIGNIALRLQTSHNSTVSMIDRLETNGLVVREKDTVDTRRVYVRVTERGVSIIHHLADAHLQAYEALGENLLTSLQEVVKLAQEGE